MPTRKDLAKIHIAKKELELDDAAYRNLLWEHYQCESAADLIERFRRKGWRPASFGQRGLIQVLWHRLQTSGAVHHSDEHALEAFLQRAVGKEDLRRLNVHEASRVIEMLKKWLERSGVQYRRSR